MIAQEPFRSVWRSVPFVAALPVLSIVQVRGAADACQGQKVANLICMAELFIDAEELVVRLRPIEKVEAVHGEVRVPKASIRSVQVLDDAIGAVHGFRVGTGIPGSVAVGTFTDRDAKTFAVVHHDTPRGILVRLEGANYDQLIVGCDHPESIAAQLR